MASSTAVILIDPYNDFLHPEGKATPALADSLKETDTVKNILELLSAARASKIPVYYGLHQQYKDGHYDGWKHMTKTHPGIKSSKLFEEGSWGAEFYKGMEPQPSNGDVVVSKHWNSSSFANTDLDYVLRQREITHLVLAGLVANTCLESTARAAVELGYHITLLTDATAGFSIAGKNAATDVIWPLLTENVTTVAQWAATLKK